MSANLNSCYIEGTEVLTDHGFKDFRDLTRDDKLAQLNTNNNVAFVQHYENVVQDYEGELVCLKSNNFATKDLVSVKVTPNHRMVISRKNRSETGEISWNSTEIVEAKNLSMHSDVRVFLAANNENTEKSEFSNLDRLKIAHQAECEKDTGFYKIRFKLTNKNKISRLIQLLNNEKIVSDVIKTYDNQTEISFLFNNQIKLRDFSDWVDLKNVNPSWGSQFLEELSHWSGTEARGKFGTYNSKLKVNADIVQAIAVLSGKKTRSFTTKTENSDLFNVFYTEGTYSNGEDISLTREHYKGKVYCARLPEGRLLVRYEGKVLVCGNS